MRSPSASRSRRPGHEEGVMRTRPLSRRLLVVACGLIYFFLMLPLLVVFPISLSSAPYMQFPPPGLSWQWYERFLDDPQWIDSTWRSLYIGGATAVLALLLGGAPRLFPPAGGGPRRAPRRRAA